MRGRFRPCRWFHNLRSTQVPTQTPHVPDLNESEPTMDVQFPDASALVQDPASGSVHLNAQATGPVSAQVPFSAVLGAGGETTTLQGEVTETTRGPIPTVIQSFTDANGVAWQVSEDGQTVSPPAS